MAEFVKQHERKAWLRPSTRYFEDEPPTAEETALLQGIRKTQRKLLEPESCKFTR
ncbi:MAG TPA: hypothetical protein VFE33_23630 [Thermoanaerobaculia bacterium]|nr:hypothetical protein [Thermoanaerobaculia bacterium]